MSTFVLVRHAAVDGLGVRINGRSPGVALNTQGRLEAKQLAKRFAGLRCQALYSSPMERTMETAREIERAAGLPVVTEPGLNEIDYGHWTGKTFTELDAQPEWQRYNACRHSAAIPAGETMAQLRQRLYETAERLRKQHDGTAILVTHADCIRAMAAVYTGATLDTFQRFQLVPASISVLSMREGRTEVVRWNDAPSAGPPSAYSTIRTSFLESDPTQ